MNGLAWIALGVALSVAFHAGLPFMGLRILCWRAL